MAEKKHPTPSFKTTAQILENEGLKDMVDQLAQAQQFESEAIGYAGAPSETYQIFRKIVKQAKREEILKLLFHQSPIVRAYMIQETLEDPDPGIEAVYPLFYDSTNFGTLRGCIESTYNIASWLAEGLCQLPMRPQNQDVLLRAARDESVADEVRGELLKCLVDTHPHEVIPIALSLLKSENSREVVSAIDALGRVKARSTFFQIAPFASSSDMLIRASVAGALGNLGDPAGKEIVKKLLHDPDPYVRMRATSAFFKLDGKDTGIIQALLKDDAAREAAIKGLIAQGTEQSLNWAVDELIQNDSAASSDLLDLSGQKNELVKMMMRRLLNESQDGYYRETAARYLGEMEDKESLKVIRALLTEEKTIGEQRVAAEFVAKWGDRESIPLLVRLLGNSNPHAQISAANALVVLKAKAALPALQKAIKTTSPWAKEELQNLLLKLKKS